MSHNNVFVSLFLYLHNFINREEGKIYNGKINNKIENVVTMKSNNRKVHSGIPKEGEKENIVNK